MNSTSSNTSFFSFGPDDSFISKSFEGLRYRNLPPSLQDLIVGGSVLDVHWASLGHTTDSWILSFKDASGKNNLGWGPSIPSRLQTTLSKLAPTQHLRTFLGPNGSFIAWDPNFIRWANLPISLEDALQAWLTPAGWKAGPPRMMTWGVGEAFFAISEYGNVVYRLGGKSSEEEDWSIWRETIEEWKGEREFLWSEVAYISLDPIIPDQFIAIRNDGTWAGSIDDSNEEALSAFALNFFRLAKPHSKSKAPPRPQPSGHIPQTNGIPNPLETMPDPAAQALYEKWATDTATLFASALAANGGAKRAPKKLQIRSRPSQVSVTGSTTSIPSSVSSVPHGKLLSTFPYLPSPITTCSLPLCTTLKADTRGLRACRHDVENLLKASGLYSYEWLRQERIRWHPDRFGRLCEEGWREDGRRLAEEMFKIIDILMKGLEGSKGMHGS